MANHAGNRGTDQYGFSAVKCPEATFTPAHFKVIKNGENVKCKPFWMVEIMHQNVWLLQRATRKTRSSGDGSGAERPLGFQVRMDNCGKIYSKP